MWGPVWEVALAGQPLPLHDFVPEVLRWVTLIASFLKFFCFILEQVLKGLNKNGIREEGLYCSYLTI